eukprot:1160535-Pelagomonas_calceolata.AAC.4
MAVWYPGAKARYVKDGCFPKSSCMHHRSFSDVDTVKEMMVANPSCLLQPHKDHSQPTQAPSDKPRAFLATDEKLLPEAGARHDSEGPGMTQKGQA